jgi:hypothetical protein
MPEPSAKGTLSSLAREAFADVRSLARETAELFRNYTANTHNTGRTRMLLIAGAGIVLVGAILVCLTFVHLLAWGLPNQPIWISYGAIAVPVLGIGIALMAMGRKRMRSFDPLRAHSAKVMQDVTATVEHVSQAVDAARESFHESANSVREAFDVNDQFRKRPWAVMAGAVTLGYLGGAVLHGSESRQRTSGPTNLSEGAERKRGSIAHLVQQFEPELVQLESLAMGALFGIVRDFLTKTAPQPMENELEKVINGVSDKLNGTPTSERVRREPLADNGASHTSRPSDVRRESE